MDTSTSGTDGTTDTKSSVPSPSLDAAVLAEAKQRLENGAQDRLVSSVMQATVKEIVEEQVKFLVRSAVMKSKNDIENLLVASIGPTIQSLVKASMLSKITGSSGTRKLLTSGVVTMPRTKAATGTTSGKEKTVMAAKPVKKATTKKVTKKATPAKKMTKKVRGTGASVQPTRGRFQIFNISELSVPYSDETGRLLVTCKYSDGIERIYTYSTIHKNRDALSRVLGNAAVKKVLVK